MFTLDDGTLLHPPKLVCGYNPPALTPELSRMISKDAVVPAVVILMGKVISYGVLTPTVSIWNAVTLPDCTPFTKNLNNKIATPEEEP